jgi:hypothetical protein
MHQFLRVSGHIQPTGNLQLLSVALLRRKTPGPESITAVPSLMVMPNTLSTGIALLQHINMLAHQNFN